MKGELRALRDKKITYTCQAPWQGRKWNIKGAHRGPLCWEIGKSGGKWPGRSAAASWTLVMEFRALEQWEFVPGLRVRVCVPTLAEYT